MKRRAIICFLAVFTIWPMAHRVMVAHWKTNPWKFFGWAMFCVPYPKSTMEVNALKDGMRYPIKPFVEDVIAINRYDFRRNIYGPRLSQRRLADEILKRHPEIDSVRTLVRSYHLDAQSALLRWEGHTTIHDRGGRDVDQKSTAD